MKWKKKKFYVGHKGSSERLQTIFYENPRHENKLVSEKYRKTWTEMILYDEERCLNCVKNIYQLFTFFW